MATPKPGEIRCPTCHRSTPPAAFCTQCGTAIPPDARIRPRGMDRDELQERIRARRSGADPYRRGGVADDEFGGYERYQPEPEDAHARSSRREQERHDRFDERRPRWTEDEEATAGAPARPDLTRDDDEWRAAPPPPVAPASMPSRAAASEPEEPAHAGSDRDFEGEAAFEAADDDGQYGYDDAYAYDYDEWEEREDRRPAGAGAFAILGFLALGVLALVGGAVIAGLGGDPGTGLASPTATPAATVTETAAPTPEPTDEATPAPSPDGTPAPDDDEPIVFPDGFVAEGQPCLPGSAGTNGCDSNAESNTGSLWVWVGFRNGTQNDVIGAELIGPEGNSVGQGSIDLARIGCRPTCPGGWTYFPFSNLPPGEYTVEITRNGEPADTMRFEVT
jgi:hypothetical protein